MNPFFIRERFEKAAKEWGETAKKLENIHEDKVKVKGLQKACEQATSAYHRYKIYTKTWGGYLKSFIPLTNAFSARLKLAKALPVAEDMAKKQSAKIDEFICTAPRTITRSHSAPPSPRKKDAFKPVLRRTKSVPFFEKYRDQKTKVVISRFNNLLIKP